MEKLLLIAEKPSVMRELQAVYKKHKSEIPYNIDFAALSGHVCGYAKPNEYPAWQGMKWKELPTMIPNEWLVVINDDKRELFDKIKSQYNKGNYDGLICATDSDREGNLIYYLLEKKLGLQKVKTYRMWLHAETESELLKAFKNMKDFHKDSFQKNLTYASILRSQFDWLIGMNCTVQASLKSNMKMRVGRVKVPTLKLVYDNSMAIDNFVPKTSFQVSSEYKSGFSALYVDDEFKPIDFESKEKANGVLKKLTNKATIENVSKEKVQVFAPPLYKLSDVQIDANKKFGYSADKTLSLIQSLYETHKVVSYPRGDCRFISISQCNEIPNLLKSLSCFSEYAPYLKISSQKIQQIQNNKKYVNDKEVEKSSHTALIPTGVVPDLAKLSEDETNILKLIYGRFLSIFLPPIVEEKTTIILNNNNHKFKTTGSVVLDKGFSAIIERNSKDNILPQVAKGDTMEVSQNIVREKVSKPPSRLTEGELIKKMENIGRLVSDDTLRATLVDSKGIGTPATRGAIIKELINSGYIDVKKQGKASFLFISNEGKAYIENLSGFDICNPELTATWEEKLKSVEQGALSPRQFSDEMKDYLHLILNQISTTTMNVAPKIEKESLGACPRCGKSVYESKKSYYCEGFKSEPKCDFAIWRDNAFFKKAKKKLTPSIVKKLLKDGSTMVNGFTSGSGKKYNAKIELDVKESGFAALNVSFPDTKNSKLDKK